MNDGDKINLKNKLKQMVIEILHSRMEAASLAMREAQMAANEEGKSSMGDKYETSKAMAQIDRDIHARQRQSALKEINLVQQIDVSLFSGKV